MLSIKNRYQLSAEGSLRTGLPDHAEGGLRPDSRSAVRGQCEERAFHVLSERASLPRDAHEHDGLCTA